MLVSAQNLSFGFNAEPLFDKVDFLISEGDRIGLIGANGEGKTTLIRLILGELSPESGTLVRKNGARIGYLAQVGGYDSENTVLEEMREIFAEDERLLLQLSETEKEISKTDAASDTFRILSARYESLIKRVTARDSYNVEVKIKTVLNGMGFADFYQRKVSTMSGGEKTRLKLCRLLLEEPELLILDEPTNHLDLKTSFWLEEYLSTYKGAIFTVSHDRYFLDKTVTQIYELENKTLSPFKGNYTKYKVLKAEKVARITKEYEKQQVEIAHMEDYVARNLVRATTAKSALDRVKKLERIERIEKPVLPPSPPKFRFTFAERPSEQVLTVDNLTLCAGEKQLLQNVSFGLKRGEKCAVVGDNGTGKSTLVKRILQGDDSVKLGRYVKIAFYDQENANLNPENTVLAELWERHVLWDQKRVRSALARAKLDEKDVDKKVKMLSGGERAKLALSVFESEEGNFLILDEPTNHLDLPAREALEDALKEFEGTLLFVSHDRYFIDALAGKIVELSNGNLSVFTGNYDEYNASKMQEKTAPVPEKKVQKAVNESGYKSKEERVREAKTRERSKQIEKEIELLETEETAINGELSLPEVTGDYALLTKKCRRLEEIRTRIDELYAEYESLI